MMTTQVQIPTAEFPIDRDTFFHIGWNEAGAMLSLFERKQRRCYRFVVDGSAIVHAAVEAVFYRPNRRASLTAAASAANDGPDPNAGVASGDGDSEGDSIGRNHGGHIWHTVDVMRLIECSPGSRDHEAGEAVSLIQSARSGEAQMPMMLGLRDTRTLMIGLPIVLATHGDDTADVIMRRYFHDH
jgi:hypothetical protein